MTVAYAAVFADYLRATGWRWRGAQLAPRVRIGPGCKLSRASGFQGASRAVLEADVVLKFVGASASLTLGEHVFIGRGCQFDLSGPVNIGPGSLLAPGCFITDHNHGIAPGLPIWQQSPVYAPVVIGSDCWLGARAIVLPGVTIGDGAVVGAGAVVTHSVEPGCIVAGVPARVIGRRGEGVDPR
jgi:acetyltransferase-like isoleucine patch superfamily enzyme